MAKNINQFIYIISLVDEIYTKTAWEKYRYTVKRDFICSAHVLLHNPPLCFSAISSRGTSGTAKMWTGQLEMTTPMIAKRWEASSREDACRITDSDLNDPRHANAL